MTTTPALRAMPNDRDAAVRLRAFDFLTDQRLRRFGEASIPRSALERGFDSEGVEFLDQLRAT